jgi:hypothetical protein
LAQSFDKLLAAAGDKVRSAVVQATTVAAAAAVGAAVGSVIPGGTLVGGAGDWCSCGHRLRRAHAHHQRRLADEVFTPINLQLTVPSPWDQHRQTGAEIQLTHSVREHGADYDIIYDWRFVK